MSTNRVYRLHLDDGSTVISNGHFDTTRANVENQGAEALEGYVRDGLRRTLEWYRATVLKEISA